MQTQTILLGTVAQNVNNKTKIELILDTFSGPFFQQIHSRCPWCLILGFVHSQWKE